MLLISAVDEEIKRRMRGVGWGGKSLEVAAESRFWGRNEHCLDRLSSRQSFKSQEQILGLKIFQRDLVCLRLFIASI